MNAEDLSHYLRTGGDLFLWCRRGIVLTSLGSAICMILVGVYQVGIIKHLLEPPLRFFDADKVDAAPEAYSRLFLPMPDAFLGLVSYAITAALAALGGADRFERLWWIPLAMAAKVGIDAFQAASSRGSSGLSIRLSAFGAWSLLC